MQYLIIDEKVLFSLVLEKADGSGSSGEGVLPTVALRKRSDGKYLDWNDNTFKAAAWVTRKANLTEVSAADSPGVYEKLWDSSGVITVPGVYVVEYESTGVVKGVSNDVLVFRSVASEEGAALVDDDGGQGVLYYFHDSILQVRLVSANDRSAAVTGVAAPTVTIKKSELATEAVTLGAGDWVEDANVQGTYSLRLRRTTVNKVGPATVSVTAAGAAEFVWRGRIVNI